MLDWHKQVDHPSHLGKNLLQYHLRAYELRKTAAGSYKVL